MKRIFKILFVFVLFCICKNVYALQVESIADTSECLYYNFDRNEVLFLRYKYQQEGNLSNNDFFYISTHNMSTGFPNQTEFGILDNSDKKINECPKFISYVSQTQSEHIEFQSSDDKSTLSGKIYEYITDKDNNILQCDYSAYNVFYYDDKDKYFWIPDLKVNVQDGYDFMYYSDIAKLWHEAYVDLNGEMGCPQLATGTGSGLKLIMSDSFSFESLYGDSYITDRSRTNTSNVPAICNYYRLYFNQIKDNYQQAKDCDKNVDQFCDSKFYFKADDSISYVNQICGNLIKKRDYDDSCVIKCLDFSDDLKRLKDQYGIKYTNSTCGMSDRIIKWLANVVKWVKYIAPVLVIILGILDFIKAFASGNDDEMKKVKARFVKRLISAALLFIVPFIIEFVLDVFNLVTDNPYCNLF